MDHTTARDTNTRIFSDLDYSDSDYLELARAYRNQEGAAIVIEAFKALSDVLRAKLAVNWFALFKRA